MERTYFQTVYLSDGCVLSGEEPAFGGAPLVFATDVFGGGRPDGAGFVGCLGGGCVLCGGGGFAIV